MHLKTFYVNKYCLQLCLQGMISLRELVSKMTENDSFHWRGRTKQIDCICNFILLDPQVGQVIINFELIKVFEGSITCFPF